VPNLDTLVIRTAQAPCSQEDPTAQHHNSEEAVLTETASHPDQNNEEFYASVRVCWGTPPRGANAAKSARKHRTLQR
jgi:hypothetical protein